MAKQNELESPQHARAAQDLEDIARLRKNPAFKRYFERRVISEVKRIGKLILSDRELSKEDLFNMRMQFFAAYDTVKMILQDEAACVAMLEELATGEEEPEQAVSH